MARIETKEAADALGPRAAGAAAPLARTRKMGFGPDAVLGWFMVSPVLVYILILVGYPFFLSIYFSLSHVTVAGGDAGFVGFANFTALFGDKEFQKGLFNSLSFTFFAEIGKAVLGIGLAFLLLQVMPGKKFFRFFLMLPWTMPISLALIGWKWMYDPEFSVLNWLLIHAHLIRPPGPDWLGDSLYTYLAILSVNIWRGFPFSAVIVLAGLTSIPQDMFDAAKVDGAGFFRTWHYVITPLIAPILFIGLIFDVTFTLGDLTIVYLLSNGGPGYSTEILPLLAYQQGIVAGDLSRGSAFALVLFPFLFAGVIFFLRLLYRRQDA